MAFPKRAPLNNTTNTQTNTKADPHNITQATKQPKTTKNNKKSPNP
jgi:hypothetical protein